MRDTEGFLARTALLDAGALLTRRARIHGEPNHAVGGMLLCRIDERSLRVRSLDEGALGIEPFEDDELAAEVREPNRLAVDVGEGEVGGLLADRSGRRAGC